ncbi:MAG: hypothetical protein IJT06_02025 [Selenomonadaceae bacterium]|nr:hypothetical protein [Selenomonadaceae bacterium]
MNNFLLDTNINVERNPLWVFNSKDFFNGDFYDDIPQNHRDIFSPKKIFKHENTASLPDDLVEAIEDTRARKNLCGPFDTAEDAVAAMLAD